MSLNEEKFEQPGTITEIKDEVEVILSLLNNIVSRVNDLDKFTRDLFGKLDNEIHSICFKLKTLQENITLLTDAIAQKITNESLSLEMRKSSKTFADSTTETQQVYSTSLPIKILEGNNAKRAIKGLMDHHSKSKGMLQSQLVKEGTSEDHFPASGSAVSQGGSYFYIFPLHKGKPQGKSAVNTLSAEEQYLPYNIGHMNTSHSRVLYGIGKAEAVLSQPPPLTDYPLVPEAPPPSSDCLIQLTSPKAPSAPRVVSSACPQVSSSLETSATTSACLKSTSKIDLKMPLQPDLNSQSLNSQSRESVVDRIDSTLAVQPQQHSTCQFIKSFPRSLKSTKSSPVSPSKSRSVCGLPPENKTSNTLGSSSAQLPRSSRVPDDFVSKSASSNPKIQIPSNNSESPKRSVKQLTKLIEAQLRSSMTNPPQSKLCFTSTKVTTPQSSSSVTSSVSSHRALAISQDAIVPPYVDIRQNPPSILPTMNKARTALMAAIRKGVQLRKTRRSETELHENAAHIIQNRRKLMG